MGMFCLCGYGDDDFFPATKEQIIERLDHETIETERGMEYRFRLTVWAEPKEE